MLPHIFGILNLAENVVIANILRCAENLSVHLEELIGPRECCSLLVL
jgi:hypothetical protein